MNPNRPLRLTIGLGLVAAVAFAVSASFVPSTIAGEVWRTTATFEPGPCGFALPEGQVEGETVRCGVATLPQDPARPRGARLQPVKLPVAVFTAGGERRESPLLLLQGGPGGASLGPLTQFFGRTAASPLQDVRDLVMFDQRGTGAATPIPECESPLGAAALAGASTSAALLRRVENVLANCRDELRAKGVEPRRFTSRESALDAAAVMRALGHASWNVYGVSYGGFAAFEMLRQSGDGVQTVILDAPATPGKPVFLDALQSFDRATALVAEQCHADPECDRMFPDLLTRFDTALRGLLAKPLVRAVPKDSGEGTRRETLTAATAIQVIQILLRSNETIPTAARAMDAIARGDWPLHWSPVPPDPALASGLSPFVFLSTICAEQAALATTDEGRSGRDVRPGLAALLGPPPDRALQDRLCESWGVHVADQSAELLQVRSIPALLLTGEFDPIVPPPYAAAAAAAFAPGYEYVVPGSGHGVVLQSTCALAIVSAFLADPGREPAHGCLTAGAAMRFLPRPAPSVDGFAWFEGRENGGCDGQPPLPDGSIGDFGLCVAMLLHNLPGDHRLRFTVFRDGQQVLQFTNDMPRDAVAIEQVLPVFRAGSYRVEVAADGVLVGSSDPVRVAPGVARAVRFSWYQPQAGQSGSCNERVAVPPGLTLLGICVRFAAVMFDEAPTWSYLLIRDGQDVASGERPSASTGGSGLTEISFPGLGESGRYELRILVGGRVVGRGRLTIP